jgi:hypothetical protein
MTGQPPAVKPVEMRQTVSEIKQEEEELPTVLSFVTLCKKNAQLINVLPKKE